MLVPRHLRYQTCGQLDMILTLLQRFQNGCAIFVDRKLRKLGMKLVLCSILLANKLSWGLE
jgi:hypothetical protein